jgi:AraC-like DNA-binding protein
MDLAKQENKLQKIADSGSEGNIRRLPTPTLRPFIKFLWASDEKETPKAIEKNRERLLPTGSMHLIFRLTESPIRIFDSIEDYVGHNFRFGVVAGMRSGFYVKDIPGPVRTVGALLEPGVAKLLFGVSAEELTNRHTSIEDLWGRSSIELWEQMQDVSELRRQLDLFELFLAQRLPQVYGIHPAIVHALSRFSAIDNVGQIVEETGYSHRRFIEIFRRTVGLPPRLYYRVIRFQRALKMAGEVHPNWINIALELGYSDQAHFNREFREFAGVSPSEYRKLGNRDSYHVPILRKR